MKTEDTVLCETPAHGKKPTRILKWKFDIIRKNILRILPKKGEGFPFLELPEQASRLLTKEVRHKTGSISWYTTTVKLALEVRGEIERVSGSKPQRLRRVS